MKVLKLQTKIILLLGCLLTIGCCFYQAEETISKSQIVYPIEVDSRFSIIKHQFKDDNLSIVLYDNDLNEYYDSQIPYSDIYSLSCENDKCKDNKNYMMITTLGNISVQTIYDIEE